VSLGLDAWRRRAAVWARWLNLALARRFALSTREERIFFLLIPTVGLAGGLSTIFIQRASEFVRVQTWGYWPSFEVAARHISSTQIIGALALGGITVGLIVFFAPGTIRWGVGATLESVMLKGGRMPINLVGWSVLASIATVGTGGSLGREGPMLALSAATASWLGQRFRLDPHRLKILVGCGTAAGFAAAYKVPIGGSLFAMEVVLGSFALEIFGPIVVAAVISSLLTRAAESGAPIYPAPGYELTSSWEIGAYLALGLIGAVAGVLFVRGIAGIDGLFRRMRALPKPLLPVIALILVGGIAVYEPRICGNGFDTITDALHEQIPLRFLISIALLKWLATGLTTGGGCPGGHFTPSLCFGALVGGSFGEVVHKALPNSTSTSGAYAAIGMAAVAAATSQAPLSATLMLFEFTGNYDLILPIMAASMVAAVVARRIHPWSIYTERLRHKGARVGSRREEIVLEALKASDLMREDTETLLPSTSFSEIVDRFLSTRRHRLFVVDENGQLLGRLSLHEIKHALADAAHLSTVVAYDLTLPVDTFLRKSDTLKRAGEMFAVSDFERLPVVEDGSRKLLGVLAKRDLLALYAQELLGRPRVLSAFVESREPRSSERLELPPDFVLRTVSLPQEFAGRSLAEAQLAQQYGVWVLEIKREREGQVEWIVPGARTTLDEGDEIVVLGPTAAVVALASASIPPTSSSTNED